MSSFTPFTDTFLLMEITKMYGHDFAFSKQEKLPCQELKVCCHISNAARTLT